MTSSTTESSSTLPFTYTLAPETITDLLARLQSVRLPPESSSSPSWQQGVPLSTHAALLNHWRTDYDMGRLPQILNTYPQYKSTICGLDLHFWHIPSPSVTAIPLLLLHGWPGSILEFRHVVPLLSSPVSPEDQAFHLVIPSLPGYGFSEAPKTPGFGYDEMANLMDSLMDRLGYTEYVVSGGDFGADIAAAMGHLSFPNLAGVHLTSAFFDAQAEIASSEEMGEKINSAEEEALRRQEVWERDEDGYFKQQATYPQTLGYALSDSPSGLAAWIGEKIVRWSQHRTNAAGGLESEFLNKDEVLDDIMLYWVSGTETTSMSLYWEEKKDTMAVKIPKTVAVGVSLFPADVAWADRKWGQRYYARSVYWREVEEGGHFAAWERPEHFAGEVRAFVNKAGIH